MALNGKGAEIALQIATDITVAALGESPNVSFVGDGQLVGEFFETIYKKVEELIVTNTDKTST